MATDGKQISVGNAKTLSEAGEVRQHFSCEPIQATAHMLEAGTCIEMNGHLRDTHHHSPGDCGRAAPPICENPLIFDDAEKCIKYVLVVAALLHRQASV